MTTSTSTHPKLLATLAALLVGLLTAMPGPVAAASDLAPDGPAKAITDQYNQMASVPAAFAVIDGDDTIFGGQEGGGPDTPFIIGSLTKSFTALTVLALVQREELDLDRPVQSYLPDLSLERAGERVTLRHLLSHTAGIDVADCNKDGESTYNSLESRVDDLRGIRLTSTPGNSFEYCNVGYAVLARVIEVQTERPFAEVLDTNVLRPLGLNDTQTDLQQARSAGLVEGRTTIMGVPVTRPERAADSALPDGYLVSTARNLAEYARFQMGDGTRPDGTRLLSTDLMHEMHTSQTIVPGLPPEMANYGMGWFVGSEKSHTVLWHGGTNQRYQTDLAMLPNQGRAVVSLAAGQWLAGTKPLTDASIAVLLNRDTEPSHMYLIATLIMWLALGTLIATITCSLIRSRHRRATGRRPRRWAAILFLLGAVLLPVAFTLPAVQELGSIERAWRFGWQAAPDVLALELAWVLTLFWIGLRALANSMNSRHSTP